MPRVLIVDQDHASLELAKEALGEHGVEVETSGDGALALQLVRTSSPDAVILSVDLRGVSGYSVCNKLKKDPALARVPLLLTSREASEETFSQHSRLKTRAEGYLRWPFDRAALWAAVAQLWEPPVGAEATALGVPPGASMEAVAVSWETPATPPGEMAAALPPAHHDAAGHPGPATAATVPPPGGTPQAAPPGPAGAGPEGPGAARAAPLTMGDASHDRTRPEGGLEAAADAAPAAWPPEVTVVRATDLDALEMTRGQSPARPAAAADAALAARLDRLEAEHRDAEGRWRAELEGTRAELEGTRAEAAELRDLMAAHASRQMRAALALDNALELLRGEPPR